MFSMFKTAITGTMSIIKGWPSLSKSVALLTLIGCIASTSISFAADANPYLVRTFEEDGRLIDEIIVPGRPPDIKAEVVEVPEPNLAAGINTLNTVPAFTWCYGCSATSAAMMMGYYDNQGYPNMYTGPTHGGVCPMNNETYWGHTVWPSVTCGECPLSATHIGKDGRTARGDVEDYWIDYGDAGPDPYIVNGWTEHTQGDCTADFMGTSQSKFSNTDGSTRFYNNTDGSALSDYTGCEPSRRDGCHGIKLFVTSRGYTVTANFSQYIYGYSGNTKGFTYDNFKTEIDAGRPVLIQVVGHTMLGYGYNDTGSLIYIHDTWDNSNHSMTWGGSYSSMQHYGVVVLRLQSITPGSTHALNDYDGDAKSDLAVFGSGYWYINSLVNGSILLNGKWGAAGWTTVPGDYDGDGKADLAVYANGYWYITSLANGNILLNGKWGAAGWTPVPGDYDGDGKSDLAVYGNGYWYIYSLAHGNILLNGKWGAAGWTPVPGDYDGDSKADLAVFGNGYWYITSLTQGNIYINGKWGAAGWTPVPGDYDGDGKADLAVYCNGYWYIHSLANGNIFLNGKWGAAGWIPVK